MPFDWYEPTPEQWANNGDGCIWFLKQQMRNFADYEYTQMQIARRQFDRDCEWAAMDEENGTLPGLLPGLLPASSRGNFRF